jgi:hypothetical protein
MAEGLTDDEVLAYRAILPNIAKPGETSFGRADAIRAEIFRRHKIPPGTPIGEALGLIQQRADMRSKLGVDGGEPSAWANPDERAAAREDYALQGKNPAEVQKRWDESTHLLDPRSYQYMQNFGRDLDFLMSEAEQQLASGRLKSPRRMLDANAIRHYDSNKGERLSAPGGLRANPLAMPSGYASMGGFGAAVLDNVSNPDIPLGNYMAASEVVPNTLRMQGSGESDSLGESYRRAQAQRLAQNRYRLASPHAILDMPSGSTSAEIADRLRSLRQEVADASVPLADERWQRTVGWTPPGFVSDAGDFFISMVDPTVVFPAAKGAGALANAAKAGSKAAKIAGSGWMRPAVQAAAGPAVKDLAWDGGIEQATGAALQGTTGGLEGRSSRQYLLGGGEKGKDFAYKTDAQVAEARESAQGMRERLKDDSGVSRADEAAYNRLVASGALPAPSSDLHPRPQWRMNSANKQ